MALVAAALLLGRRPRGHLFLGRRSCGPTSSIRGRSSWICLSRVHRPPIVVAVAALHPRPVAAAVCSYPSPPVAVCSVHRLSACRGGLISVCAWCPSADVAAILVVLANCFYSICKFAAYSLEANFLNSIPVTINPSPITHLQFVNAVRVHHFLVKSAHILFLFRLAKSR